MTEKMPFININLRIIKIFEYCKQEFIARKTTTQTCSDSCAKRLFKLQQRGKAIGRAEVETMVKKKEEAFITEEQVKMIQAKKWLRRMKVNCLFISCFQYGSLTLEDIITATL